MIDSIVEKYKNLEEVEAVMLGGSRATGKYDEKSDYDIYVYLNAPLSEFKRREILEKHCSYMEYSNHFWELEDDGILNNGIEIEFIYRTYNFFDNVVENMKQGVVGNGYSTCFYDNLMNSVILFDKKGKIEKLQAENHGLITDEYTQAIIDNNFPLIKKSMPALYGQVKKAMERKDYNSTNHRLSEYFAIYYDILFALNKASHPGEKRLVKSALRLKHIPENFKNKVYKVFFNMFSDTNESLENLDMLSKDIENLIIKLGYKL